MHHSLITQNFLDFYQNNNHQQVNFPSIIPPSDDTSTLFISSGMQHLKNYYLGKTPPFHHMTSSQLCLRTGDIDQVGKTDRHLTSFTMLGEFGWGVPGKQKYIELGYRLLTEIYSLEHDRLHVTYYNGERVPVDVETRDIWQSLGVTNIHGMDHDNFWQMGNSGPCGPSTEIYYDRQVPCGKTCTWGCSCDRYLEIYNIVFTQYNLENNELQVLGNLNVDTGLGLERLCMILQNTDSVYTTSVFSVQNSWLGKQSNEYSRRVIADHWRSVSCMRKEEILPSNTGRGYILRRLLRRMFLLLEDRVEEWVHLMEDEIIFDEYTRYTKMIERGYPIFLRRFKKQTTLSDCDFEDLYQTHGLPEEITRHWYQLGADADSDNSIMSR